MATKIIRGGCFGSSARRCRVAYRVGGHPDVRFDDLGFRPVAEMKETSEKGEYRVLRGGSWCNFAAYGRAAYRFRVEPGWRFAGYGFRLVALALVLLLACLLFEGCTTPRCSDFCGPGEARFCLPDDMRHALEKVDEMEKTGDRGPCHWDGPRYLITRHYLGARNDFQTEISRTVILMPGDAQCILIVESLRKDSPTGRQTETFLVPVTVEKR
jgi:hypothetical protein